MPDKLNPIPVLIALALAAACLLAVAGTAWPEDPQAYAAAKLGPKSAAAPVELAVQDAKPPGD